MDERFLLAAVLFGLVGAFGSVIFTLGYSFVFFALAGAAVLIGLICGALSPYILEEIGEYLRLRLHAGAFLLADDAGDDAPGVKAWRKP